MSNLTPDAQLAVRIQKATEIRDKAREKEIQLKTTAEIARQQAAEKAKEAFELFGVNTLEELHALATKTYNEDLLKVEEFENSVKEYATKVELASKQQGE